MFVSTEQKACKPTSNLRSEQKFLVPEAKIGSWTIGTIKEKLKLLSDAIEVEDHNVKNIIVEELHQNCFLYQNFTFDFNEVEGLEQKYLSIINAICHSLDTLIEINESLADEQDGLILKVKNDKLLLSDIQEQLAHAKEIICLAETQEEARDQSFTLDLNAKMPEDFSEKVKEGKEKYSINEKQIKKIASIVLPSEQMESGSGSTVHARIFSEMDGSNQLTEQDYLIIIRELIENFEEYIEANDELISTNKLLTEKLKNIEEKLICIKENGTELKHNVNSLEKKMKLCAKEFAVFFNKELGKNLQEQFFFLEKTIEWRKKLVAQQEEVLRLLEQLKANKEKEIKLKRRSQWDYIKPGQWEQKFAYQEDQDIEGNIKEIYEILEAINNEIKEFDLLNASLRDDIAKKEINLKMGK